MNHYSCYVHKKYSSIFKRVQCLEVVLEHAAWRNYNSPTVVCILRIVPRQLTNLVMVAVCYPLHTNERCDQRGKSPVSQLIYTANDSVTVKLSTHFFCLLCRLLYSRLLHYFRGHHHLEEIMYNENMRRSQLKTLFDKFRSVLVVTNHEDPIISIFQSPME